MLLNKVIKNFIYFAKGSRIVISPKSISATQAKTSSYNYGYVKRKTIVEISSSNFNKSIKG